MERIQIFTKKGKVADLRKVNQDKLEMEATTRGEVPGWVTGRKEPEGHAHLHTKGRKIRVRGTNLWEMLPSSCSWLN